MDSDNSDLVLNVATYDAIERFTDKVIAGLPAGDEAVAALSALLRDNPHLFDYAFRVERAALAPKAA